ncbi:MAG: cytochrome P460 family protein [Pseudomonadota bacterium]
MTRITSRHRFTLSLASILLAAGAVIGVSPVAHAADCNAGKPGEDLSFAEAQTVYDCIAEKLHQGYVTGPKGWIPVDFVDNYRSWTQASTVPAAPGFHGGRFLVTWVNQTGAAEYLKYAENPTMPAGSLLAKESFSVNDAGNVTMGPLFFMEKVAAGTSPETDDWYYYMVSPKGQPQAVNVISACSECHQGSFADTGGMGYPVEEARVQ